MIKIKNHQPYYISTIVNYLLADLLTIAYSTVLIIADLMSINWLIWRKHMICNLLRLLVSICLYCSLLEFFLSIVIITLKILYPFRHQVRWLKYVTIMSLFIWLLAMTLEIPQFVLAHNSQTYFDQFCTFLHCHQKLTYFILSSVVMDNGCVLVFCVCETKVYLSMKSQALSAQSTKQIRPGKICLKLGRRLYPDIVQRMFFSFYLHV